MMFLRFNVVCVLRCMLDLLLLGLFFGDLVGGRHDGHLRSIVLFQGGFNMEMKWDKWSVIQFRGTRGTFCFVYAGGWV
jgi:hypothetical protein